MKRIILALAGVCAAVTAASTQTTYPANYAAATLVQLNDNGAWSWFMKSAPPSLARFSIVA